MVGLYLATIIGSSSWRVNLADSLLFTNADSGKLRLAGYCRSASTTFNLCRTRSRRKILACGASSGNEDNDGVGERLLVTGSGVSPPPPAGPGTFLNLIVYTPCHNKWGGSA